LPPMQQRYGLRNSEIRVRSQESSESTYGRPPNPYHYLPRPSRWSRTYACIAVSKGNFTQALTWWPAIGQEFSPFLLKMAPREGVPACGQLSFLPSRQRDGYPERVCMRRRMRATPDIMRATIRAGQNCLKHVLSSFLTTLTLTGLTRLPWLPSLVGLMTRLATSTA
jgi:hypothetical protein